MERTGPIAASLASLALALAASPAAAGDLYGRVDADGHVHVSDVRKEGYRVLVRDTTARLATRSLAPGAAPPGSWVGPQPERCMPETLARIGREEGVPGVLLHAVAAVESACDPRAVSVKGAQGLMQLMPATAARYGVQRVFDPVENARGGARYLRDLIARYPGRTDLVLAAYNAGEEAVARYANTVPPFAETREYVRRVMQHHDRLVTPRAAPSRSQPPASPSTEDRTAAFAALAR